MTLGLFNENFKKYGILLQQTSAIEVNHSTLHEYVGETLKLIITFVAQASDEWLSLAELAPTDSLAKVILSHLAHHPSAGHMTCADSTGRLWIPHSFQLEFQHPKQIRGSIELQAPAPTKIDPGLLEGLRGYKVEHETHPKKEPRTNLIRPKGEWKVTD